MNKLPSPKSYVTVSDVSTVYAEAVERAMNAEIENSPELQRQLNEAMERVFIDDLNMMLYGTTRRKAAALRAS